MGRSPTTCRARPRCFTRRPKSKTSAARTCESTSRRTACCQLGLCCLVARGSGICLGFARLGVWCPKVCVCVYVSDKMLRLVLINSRMRQGTRGCGLRRALSQIMINNLYFNVPGQLEPVQPAASLALHG